MQNLIRYLHARGANPAVLQEVAALTLGVNQLAERVHILGATCLAYETLLEHHGLLSPEIMETIKPLLEQKARLLQPQEEAPASPEESPIADTPESTPSAT